MSATIVSLSESLGEAWTEDSQMSRGSAEGPAHRRLGNGHLLLAGNSTPDPDQLHCSTIDIVVLAGRAVMVHRGQYMWIIVNFSSRVSVGVGI